MAETNDIIIALQEAVRKAISEAANEEIEKQKHRLECKLGEVKREMVGKLVEQIQYAVNYDQIRGEYIIQVNIRPTVAKREDNDG